MKKLLSLIIVFSFVLVSFHAMSAGHWYKGKLNRVALYNTNGSFLITFSNDVLSDCKWRYSYYDVNKLGAEQVKAAYSMALLAISSGKTFGTVIDKDSRADGEPCYATGMAADILVN